jgi:hypothetical protein
MLAPEYPKLFYVGQAQTWVEDIPHMGAFGLWDEQESEGAPFNMDSMAEGDTATFTLHAYNKAYSITYESQRWDKYGQIGPKPEAMARGLRSTEETAAAAVINNGFAVTAGYDGAYLFSNTHPLKPDGADSGEDGDNLFTGALSYAKVQEAEQLMKATPNEADIIIGLRPTVLWCSTDQERAAKEILSSTNIAGELSNTRASLPPLEVLPLTYVTSPYWGLKCNDALIMKNNLIFNWGDRPIFGVKEDPNSLNRKIYGYASWTCGYADWRGIVGSLGT